MFKKVMLAVLCLFAASCASDEPVVRYCPNVRIVPEFSHLTEMSGRVPEYKIELIGYEGYCRTDIRNQTKAVISPIFEITRMTKISDDDINFAFYSDTSDNDKTKSLGKQSYPASVKIAKVGEKVIYQGDYIEVRIPNDMPGFKIKLGLALNDNQYRYNKMHGLKK